MMSEETFSLNIRICCSEMIVWIENNIAQGENISVSDVAMKAGYSLWYFQRAFKSINNITVADAIRQARLSLACERLMLSGSIADISWELGFDNQQAFTRFFKRYIGMPPGRYRRSLCNSVLKEGKDNELESVN